MTHQNYMNFAGPQENENENMSMNMNMMVNSNAAATTLVEETKKHRALYPEIHYKLKPYIDVTCDAIQATGRMPTQEEFDNIADDIHEEFCKMHPDMANYMKSNVRDDDPPEAVPTIAFDGFGRGFGFHRFGRRGIGRDLVGALLLNELFGRRFGFGGGFGFCPWC